MYIPTNLSPWLVRWLLIWAFVLGSVPFFTQLAEAGGPAVNTATCRLNGESFDRQLTVDDDIRVHQGDKVLLSGLKVEGGQCTVKFNAPTRFYLNNSQGEVWIDGRQVTNQPEVHTGTIFVVKYGRGGANGYEALIRHTDNQQPVAQPASTQAPAPVVQPPPPPAPAPVAEFGKALPAGSCDLGGNPANRKHLEAAKNGTQFWMPWSDELKKLGGPCAFNTGGYSGTIEVTGGPHKLGPNATFHKTFAAGDQSAGFGFNLDSGQSVPTASQPAQATAVSTGLQINAMPAPELSGRLRGSCTFPNGDWWELSFDPWHPKGHRLYMSTDMVAQFEATQGDIKCHFYAPRGAVIEVGPQSSWPEIQAGWQAFPVIRGGKGTAFAVQGR